MDAIAYLESLMGARPAVPDDEGLLAELDRLLGRPQWMRDGACRSTATRVFFARRGESNAPAKAVCRQCTVRHLCLAFALERPELAGVWGATAEGERVAMRRAQRVRELAS